MITARLLAHEILSSLADEPRPGLTPRCSVPRSPNNQPKMREEMRASFAIIIDGRDLMLLLCEQVRIDERHHRCRLVRRPSRDRSLKCRLSRVPPAKIPHIPRPVRKSTRIDSRYCCSARDIHGALRLG